MKRLVLFALLIAALVPGCKRHTIISDEELALIFHDAFLANSLLQNRDARRDSLLVYEPIFERYGYTTEDVRYTIGNFSKRKSARLGDVVELAIARLEAEGELLNRAVAALDTVNNVAQRTTRRVIRRDSSIRVTSLKDTARLRIVLDSVRPGEYRIRTRYEVDSLDQNQSLRGQVWMETAAGKQSGLYSIQLRRKREDGFDRTLKADTAVRRIVLDFWRPQQGKRKRPHITLRNLEITYTLPVGQALDTLYEKQLDIRLFADDFIRMAAPDSLARPADR